MANVTPPVEESDVEVGSDVVAQRASVNVQSLTSEHGDVVSTLDGDDFATKLQVFNAVTNSVPISENLGKTIQLRNVVVQSLELADQNTGELVTVPRVVFLAEDGTAYHGISAPMFNTLKTLFGIVGHPRTWEKAVPIKVTEEGPRGRQYFSLKFA